MSATEVYQQNGIGAGASVYSPQVNSVGACLIIPNNGTSYTVQVNCASLCNIIAIAHDYTTGTESHASFTGVTGVTFNTAFGANGSDIIGPGINVSTSQAWVQISISSFTGDYNSSPLVRRGGVWPNLEQTRWRVRRSGVWVPTYFKVRRSGVWVLV